MLCAVIPGPSADDIKQQILKVGQHADMLELRHDLFNQVIHTIKPKQEFIDIPSDPSIKIIRSYHDFEKTPEDLELVLKQMQEQPGDFYKIATMTHSTLDALRLLQLAQKHAPKVIAIGMGSFGQITRLTGNPWSYACVDDEHKTAPGQLSVQEMSHYKSLNASTALYGLIGNPVNQSHSHITHNAVFQTLSLNALYTKMQVLPEELESFFKLAQDVGFKGLSVTIPLKEKVIPYLDELDPIAEQIGAVNTIAFENGKIKGYNTDCVGALDAIGDVLGKNVVILGAGGAARAIIFESIKRGAHVVILNRTKEHAVRVAEEFGCVGDSLESIGQYPYDILINSTPHPLPIDPSFIIPKATVMDIKARGSELLEEAHGRGCTLVHGKEMFILQAIEQFKIWFPGKIDGAAVRGIMDSVM